MREAIVSPPGGRRARGAHHGSAVAAAAALALFTALSVPPPVAAMTPLGEPPQAVRPPSLAHGSSVARIVASTFARVRVGSKRRGLWLRPQTAWSAQPQALLVLDATRSGGREWLKVLLPVRPNGSPGWIPRDRVVLGRTPYWIDVRVRLRRVTVYRMGRRVRRFRAVVGARATPTPRGLAAVYERNRQPDPHGFLGPWALPLTVLSDVLEDYGGGPGRIGIHGRGGASLRDPLGSARSHGCIRVANRHVTWLARHVPAGTPVRIRS
jgi:lipoprotein-anchoring transpeptidase ErfK/SrfK